MGTHHYATIYTMRNYIFEEQIKHGSFGTIYRGQNKITGETVAIKLDTNMDVSIRNEVTILQHLYSRGCRVTPPVYWFGKLGCDGGYAFVMPYYTQSIAEYIKSRNHDVSLNIAKELFRGMVDVIHHIHKKWVIHRDIKPQNFMLNGDTLVLIDFGMATIFVDDKLNHLPISQQTTIVGSPRYASLFVHNGYTPTRRDDLVSAAYIFLWCIHPEYFAKSSNISTKIDTNIPIQSLEHPINLFWKERKQLNNIPTNVSNLFQYLYGLSYMEAPDYSYITNIVK